ncbi:ABC transporter permease [Streptomyces griseocarneus]|uniref:ABC transporter permease n=1 Tax=Streptomyces griseocarneus TaxID=51201 RepID=UPI001CCC0963|nr:ABC transporter permease [Streptomyces griseocarneus]MBZ6476548.1 ABC transporter permease [Streptomyces griseocarneus]
MSGPRAWARDLAMGARCAVTGGREGWLRTALTAAGVGIGVALLLVMASVPQALEARERRAAARDVSLDGQLTRPGPATLLVQDAGTEYRGRDITGSLLLPEGPRAPKPPGVAEFPRPGEMTVSPALAALLRSGEGELLRERLPYRITGTIGRAGLLGPDELVYYAGAGHLVPGDPDSRSRQGAVRVDDFARVHEPHPMRTELRLLAAMACAVVLMSVAVLIATAVRFGGERRDLRLAALRLVGADSRMTRRVAAGEALSGSLLGLVVGTGLFFAVRGFAPWVRDHRVGVFPSDVAPGVTAAVGIALAVPVAAVLVSLFALRDVAIEPLGVVRETARRPRRLWWRLLLPAVGLALLIPVDGKAPGLYGGWLFGYQVAIGSALLLAGVTALLPWLVGAFVARLRGGPPSWQLAVRRLQLDGGPASRAVSGIIVAVAGAISLQLLLAGTNVSFPLVEEDGRGKVVTATVPLPRGGDAGSLTERLAGTAGVRKAAGRVTFDAFRDGRGGRGGIVPVSVADCASLRDLAGIGPCRDGDVFVGRFARPGMELQLQGVDEKWLPWKVPDSAPAAPEPVRDDAFRRTGVDGVLATPGALDTHRLRAASAVVTLRLDPTTPEALEYLRNAAARTGPRVDVVDTGQRPPEETTDYWPLLRALPAGAALTLALIAASLTLATYEQLRERKRVLATLSAFGTRTSTVAWSVVWQTAIPVLLGMTLAVTGGLALGWAMLRVVSRPVRDWFAFLPVVGWGLGVVALITAAALPALWRLTRPDGLRAE